MPEELPEVPEGDQLHLLLDDNKVYLALLVLSTIRKKFETMSWRGQTKRANFIDVNKRRM